jgi:hypothetical protein
MWMEVSTTMNRQQDVLAETNKIEQRKFIAHAEKSVAGTK